MGFASVLVVGASGVVETVRILSSAPSICTLLSRLVPAYKSQMAFRKPREHIKELLQLSHLGSTGRLQCPRIRPMNCFMLHTVYALPESSGRCSFHHAIYKSVSWYPKPPFFGQQCVTFLRPMKLPSLSSHSLTLVTSSNPSEQGLSVE